LNTRLTRIFAATHGRGVYSAELSGSGVAVLNVDPQEITIDAKSGQTGTSSFRISNSGDAALSYSITASGPGGLANGSQHCHKEAILVLRF
jgi:hypothetical protein